MSKEYEKYIEKDFFNNIKYDKIDKYIEQLIQIKKRFESYKFPFKIGDIVVKKEKLRYDDEIFYWKVINYIEHLNPWIDSQALLKIVLFPYGKQYREDLGEQIWGDGTAFRLINQKDIALLLTSKSELEREIGEQIVKDLNKDER